MLTFKPQFSEPVEQDKLFTDATKFVVETQKASATVIQRHFKIGYAMAARLLDQLEQARIVGPVSGAKPREILISSVDELDHTQAPQINEKLVSIPTLSWHKTINPVDGFDISLGKDEKGELVSVDMSKYGNLILVGSQMTSISALINNIILEQVQQKSPNDLKLIIIDGFINQIDLPVGAPHLLTPIPKHLDMIDSIIKWLQMEIEHRLTNENDKDRPDILLVIHGYNELAFGYGNSDFALNRVLTRGKSVGIYTVITFDYLAPNLGKEILANNGAKVVFRPTTKQMARSSGVPESIKLESPDQAILETMYEDKRKFTINKSDTKKIYEKIYK